MGDHLGVASAVSFDELGERADGVMDIFSELLAGEPSKNSRWIYYIHYV